MLVGYTASAMWPLLLVPLLLIILAAMLFILMAAMGVALWRYGNRKHSA